MQFLNYSTITTCPLIVRDAWAVFCLKFEKTHAHIIHTGPFANGPRASSKATGSEQLVDTSSKKQDKELTLSISLREKN